MTGGTPLTVIICAYTLQRWTELAMAVEAVLSAGHGLRLILVIDHNEELHARASSSWPTVTVVHNQGRQGLSAARNTALALTSGGLVAFLDDDACPVGPWLDELLAPFDDPEVLASGGVAEPVWPVGGRPAWLPEELWWVVGCSFTGQPDSAVEVRNVMGCNMAFRAEALVAIGGFDPDLGRVGRYPVGGEETEACLRLREYRPGGRIVFTRSAVVRHQVTAGRTTFSYLLQRSFCEGLSKASLAASLPGDQALATETGYVRRVIPGAILRELGRPLDGGLLAAAGLAASVLAAAAGYLRGRSAGPAGRPGPRQPLVTLQRGSA